MTVAKMIFLLICCLCLVATQVPFAQADYYEEELERMKAERKAEEDNYTEALETWMGKNINDLIIKWGAPTTEYTMPNGNKVFVWRRVGPISAIQCTTEFFVNTNQQIFSWKWRGNDCRAK